MDVLRSKTVIGVAGATSVSSGGLDVAEIISVQRQGLQHDYVNYLFLSSGGRVWSSLGHVKRIFFNSSMPIAVGGETIFIIYKMVI